MSMGWSWALFLANETISAIVRESSPHPSAELREKLPVPSISDFDTISSTYVHNVTIIGASQQHVKDRVALVDAAFKRYDIPCGLRRNQFSVLRVWDVWLISAVAG